MAASSPLSNFFSFLLPTKPPPQPKLPPFQVPVTTSPTQSQKVRDGRVSLVAQESHSASSSLSSVICPSLAYSNTLFFKSAYNVQVVVDDNESEERLLNRFRREVMRAGVIQECKRRRYHENTQEKKKRKNREAAKRNRKSEFYSSNCQVISVWANFTKRATSKFKPRWPPQSRPQWTLTLKGDLSLLVSSNGLLCSASTMFEIHTYKICLLYIGDHYNRRGPPPRFLERNKTEAPTNKRDADDEDNWDLPAGDIPY
ncbi:hypothetical protein F8388_010304 [Cannabis sativa]|uniref:30S ribosomal protein S21, chloroplastic n=1 Tax=Cannabis sativa TaxID=3483 RepID=A0A7J6GSK3_CANSA|nr:hypothetical protein F8388_010304 [Cannabis sativa]